MTTAIRTKCRKCNRTIRAMDADSWQNVTTENEVLRLSSQFSLWWVHGVKCRECPQGGHHNPENYE